MNLRWSRLSVLVPGAALLLLAAAAAITAGAAPAPPQFVEPADGAMVTSPLVIRFRFPDAEMDAGAMKHMQGAGAEPHVHLIVDSPAPEAGAMVPSDGRHRHLMHGERQTTLPLQPGDHTLQLVVAAANHRIGTPPVASERITVHVAAKSAARGGADEVVGERMTPNPAENFASAGEFGAACPLPCSRLASYAAGQDLSMRGGADPITFRRFRIGARL
jgi:hypothetical protein